MRGNNKLRLLFSIMLLCGFTSCGNTLDKLKNKNESAVSPATKEADGPNFLPTDLKYISISVTQENGEGFIISTASEKNKGKPEVEDGKISFKIDYETFSSKKDDLSIRIDIFSLVKNGILDRSFSTQNFDFFMDPGVYIITVTISKGNFPYPPFKSKMVVKCDSSLANKFFTIDKSKLQIAPVADAVWPEQNNRPIYFGRFQHSLLNNGSDVVIPPEGANLGEYTFNMDSNGDGTLEVINGVKQNQASFGMDIINRAIYSKPITYSTFADNKRFITYEVYDECFNVQAFEVATGDSGIFGIIEKEDLVNAQTMPKMSEQVNLIEDPSYMVQHKKSFAQQMHEQSANCNDRSNGGVNYPQGCDTRLNGTLSLIPVMNRVSVNCSKTNNSSLSVIAKEIQPQLNEGLNYNILGEYGLFFTINGISQKESKIGDEHFIELDPTNARLDGYTFTVPGTGDSLGKEVLTTNNCSVKVLLPIIEKLHTPCGSGTTGEKGFRKTVQDIRVAYHCAKVKSLYGKEIEVAGELYCNSGIKSEASDCVNDPVPTPTGFPTQGTPVPTVPVPTATNPPVEEGE